MSPFIRRPQKVLPLNYSNVLQKFLFIYFQGSRDNMSIIIIAFPAAPKIDPEAQRKDEELNKVLQQKVAGNHNRYHLRCEGNKTSWYL